MNCDEVRKELAQGANPEENEDIKNHLAVCPSCTEEKEAFAGIYSGISSVLEDNAAEASPSQGAWALIQRRISQKRRRWIPNLSPIKSKVAGWARAFWARPLWQRSIAGAVLTAVIAISLVVIDPVARLLPYSDVPPHTAFARAVDVITEVTSYRITDIQTLSHRPEGEETDRHEYYINVNGDYKVVSYRAGVIFKEHRHIGDDVYLRDDYFTGGKWEKNPSNVGFGVGSIDHMNDMSEYMSNISNGVDSHGNTIDIMREEVINGVRCLRYKITTINDNDGIEEEMVNEFWLGKEDSLVYKHYNAFPYGEYNGPHEERDIWTSTMTFFDFNETFEIEAPI